MRCTIKIGFENEYEINNGLVPVMYSAREITGAHILNNSGSSIGRTGNFVTVVNMAFDPSNLIVPLYIKLDMSGTKIAISDSANKITEDINIFLINKYQKVYETRLSIEELKTTEIITIRKVDK